MYIDLVYNCSISLALHAPYVKYAYISKDRRYFPNKNTILNYNLL